MKPVSILIVEDDRSLRHLISMRLRRGFHVREATNGQEALELISEALPDLVISDIMMPVMDGLTLCAALRRDPRTHHLPFVALTARARIKNMEEGFQAGVDQYLTKPIDVEDLYVRVSRLLG